tara:strand:- start:574 stop:1626 length:1053 start_codon:yes stop_codon:yes gene_type:complete
LKILISGASSWSIWKFRKNLINFLEKEKYELFYHLRDNYFLKKISNNNNFLKLTHMFDIIGLRRVLKKNQIKVVLEYDLKNLIKHKILRLFYNKYKIIVIWAGLGNNYNLKGYFNKAELFLLKFLMSSCEKIILINKFDYKTVKKYKLHQLITYITTEGFTHNNFKQHNIEKKDNYKFVSAFRPIKTKGIFEIVSIANKFPNHDFYIYVVKNNKTIKYNSKNIELTKLKKYKNIHIKNIVNNFEKEITKYDCLISASYGEGFGMTIAEAVNNLIPVISTKVSGPLSVYDSKSLIFINPKQIKDLENGINIFLKKTRREKISMAMKAKKNLKRIDNNQIHKKIRDIINEAS